MEYKNYSIQKAVDPAVYSQILECCAHFCSFFILVVRDHHPDNSKTLEYILNKLKQFLVKEEYKKAWPGTEVYAETALVKTYTLNKDSIDLLKSLNHHLYDWVAPNFPEDLSIVRKDGAPFFISISHEKDCYFKITETELKTIESITSQLSDLLSEDQF